MRPSPVIVVACCALLQVSLPQSAEACSGLPCNLPAAFPVPEGGVLPSNFAELTVYSQGVFPRAAGYTLKLWEEGAPDKVLRTVKVGTANENRADFGDLLAAGKSYVVEATSCSDQFSSSLEARVRTLHFTLAQNPSDPPGTLGALTVARHGQTAVPWAGSAGCYYDLNADAVDLTLDANALPEAWRKLVTSYQLMVDGAAFSWQLTMGSDEYGPKDRAGGFYFSEPGTFRAFTECTPFMDGREVPPPGSRGLAPGKHTVWVAARVPTSPAKIVESERIEIELACPEQDAGTDAGPRGDADPGEDAGSKEDAARASDAAASSGGAAGTHGEAGDDAAGDDETSASKAEDGCALSNRGSPTVIGPAYGLLLVALAFLRRKRAVRSRHTSRRSTD